MSKLQLTKKQKRLFNKIIITLPIFIFLLIFFAVFYEKIADNRVIAGLLPISLWFLLYLFIGYDVIIKGVKNIFNKQLLGEDFLMLLASLGAFFLGVYNFFVHSKLEGFEECVAVLLFYQVGLLFESIATEKSRKSIKDLLDICPDSANLLINGQVESVFPEEVNVGDKIVIYPGEKIPLDCTLLNGISAIDNKALTGESIPIEVESGSQLLSGGINLTGELLCEVNKSYYNSTATKILDLVQNATEKKTKAENFVAKFAKFYTPIVIILAIFTAVIPPLLFGGFNLWIYRALSFLVVSCPCALVISVPMTYFVALGKASKAKILIKGSCYLESLAKANTFVFDKTGTLTKGEFQIKKFLPLDKKEQILRLAYIAEQGSSHPVAKAIIKEYTGENIQGYTHQNFAGFGVLAESENDSVLCGSANFLKSHGIQVEFEEEGSVYVAQNGLFVGALVVEDCLKSEVNDVIESLNQKNYHTVMLTGDSYNIAKKVATECNVKEFKSQLLPQDKLEEVEKLLNKEKSKGVCFIGDGINDAPVLMRSDVGVAMGALGSDVAIESADIVLLNDDLTNLLHAKKLSQRASRIVKQNVIFSIGVKCLILILSFFGITNMWVSIFGDVGVAILAILNALRV